MPTFIATVNHKGHVIRMESWPDSVSPVVYPPEKPTLFVGVSRVSEEDAVAEARKAVDESGGMASG
jgi:hypothetical protein